MATMAALAGMSSATVVASASRSGHQRNRSALRDDRNQVPLRSVRNSVSWDDGIKPSSSRLKELNEYPPLLNES